MGKTIKAINYVNDTWSEPSLNSIKLAGKVIQLIKDTDEVAKRYMYIKVAFYVDNFGTYAKGKRYTVQIKVFKNFFPDGVEIGEGDSIEVDGVLSGVHSPSGIRHFILPSRIINHTLNKTFNKLDTALDLSGENENKKTYYHVTEAQKKKRNKEFKLDVDI